MSAWKCSGLISVACLKSFHLLYVGKEMFRPDWCSLYGTLSSATCRHGNVQAWLVQPVWSPITCCISAWKCSDLIGVFCLEPCHLLHVGMEMFRLDWCSLSGTLYSATYRHGNVQTCLPGTLSPATCRHGNVQTTQLAETLRMFGDCERLFWECGSLQILLQDYWCFRKGFECFHGCFMPSQ